MNAHRLPSPDPRAAVVAWLGRNVTPLSTVEPTAPLDDLASLREIVGDAVVVGIGGSTYGAHEQFTLTHRVVRYLVEELGFRAVATEEDWDVALDLDRYVTTGEGNVDALVKESGVPWRVGEIRAAVEWLREFNEGREDKVRFVGVGVIDTRVPVYEAVSAYVAKVAPERGEELERHFAQVRPTTAQHVRWFTTQVKEKAPYVDYARAALRLVEELPHAEGDKEHALIVQHARQIVAFYEHYAFHLIDDGYRDEKMAENLRWWHQYSGQRIAYWSTHAHSANAAELTVSIPPRGALTFKATGAHLRELFGEKYVSIGITCDRGTVNSAWALPPTFSSRPLDTPSTPDDFAETPLSQVKQDQFLLDLRTVTEPAVREWLDAPAKTRIIGSIYDDTLPTGGFHMTGASLAEWLDVVIHRQVVTPTQIL